jgi:cyclase
MGELQMFRFRLRAVVAVSAALAAGAGFAQDGFDTVEIVVRPVTGNIYYLEGRGGNIGVSVGADGVLMIDSQFAQLSDRIVATVRTLSDRDILFLINTHLHGDHTGGNANIAGLGVPIVAHENVRARMALTAAADARASLPLVTFGDRITFHLNGEDVDVFRVPPAHTDGDSYIHFRDSDVLHLGDVFRTTGYPVIDLNNGGTLRGTLEAIDIAIALAGPDTRVIPGHGELSSRADLIEFRELIVEVERRVAQSIDQGMTLEQVIAAAPTADLDERWGSPERILPAVYQELAAAR